MKIKILSLFPSFYDSFLDHSIIKKGIDAKKFSIEIVNIRDYSHLKHAKVDDTVFGGSAGMLLRYDIVDKALQAHRSSKSKVILMSPKAQPLNHKKVLKFSRLEELVIICGHYEGIDSRIEDEVDELVSLGDFIVTGGEVASLVLIDSIVRLIPEVINSDSLQYESYSNQLLEHNQYTKPIIYKNKEVPLVLRTGNHQLIDNFNLASSLENTLIYRKDLFNNYQFDAKSALLLAKIIRKRVKNHGH